MIEHQAAIDAQIIGEIARDGGALELIGKFFDGGHQHLLKRVHASFGRAHVEARAGAIGKPVEIAGGGVETLAIGFGAIVLHVLVGIEAAIESEDAHVQTFVEKHLDDFFGCVRARRVRIEVDDDGIGVEVQLASLRFSERRAAACDHFLHSRGVHADHIHIALDQDSAAGAAHSISRAIQIV